MDPNPLHRPRSLFALAESGLASSALSILLVAAAPGCGGSVDASEVGPVELWLAGGDLRVESSRAQAPEPLFREDFRYGAQRWLAWAREGAMGMQARAGVLEVAPFAGEGVELIGKQGGISLLVPVQPGSALCFRGEVWTEGLEPSVESPEFFGGGFVVKEVEDWPLQGAPLPERAMMHAGARIQLAPPATAPGWRPVRSTLLVGPRTNAVVLSCVLALGGEVRDGRARFRDLQLDVIAPEVHWDRILRERAAELRKELSPSIAELEEERLRLASSSGFPSRAARAELAHRRVFLAEAGTLPGLVLLPGERVDWDLRIPEGDVQLTFGLSHWSAGGSCAARSGDAATRLAILVDGAQIEEYAVDGQTALEQRATEQGPAGVERSLRAWRGMRVTLSFCARGQSPVAITRPQVGAPAGVEQSTARKVDAEPSYAVQRW